MKALLTEFKNCHCQLVRFSSGGPIWSGQSLPKMNASFHHGKARIHPCREHVLVLSFGSISAMSVVNCSGGHFVVGVNGKFKMDQGFRVIVSLR